MRMQPPRVAPSGAVELPSVNLVYIRPGIVATGMNELKAVIGEQAPSITRHAPAPPRPSICSARRPSGLDNVGHSAALIVSNSCGSASRTSHIAEIRAISGIILSGESRHFKYLLRCIGMYLPCRLSSAWALCSSTACLYRYICIGHGHVYR